MTVQFLLLSLHLTVWLSQGETAHPLFESRETVVKKRTPPLAFEGRRLSMKFAALITEIPPAAILSLDHQHHVYIRDEKVILTCSAPDSLKVAGYTFFKEQQDQTFKELPNSGMGPYEMFRVNEDTVGNYSCVYWIMPSGQEIFSSQSNLVSVAMADPPPFPVLKVDPPSGVVNEGDSLRLTCLANGTITEKRFHFFKDGAEMDTSHEGSREPVNTSPNASVSILQATVNHSGEFACSYEEAIGGRWVMSPWSKTGKVMVNVPDILVQVTASIHTGGFACRYEQKLSSRWIMSPWSQTVNVTVWAPNSSSSPLLYARWAIPLVILMVPLAFYCTRRKRALKSEQENKEEANSEYVEMFSATRKPQRTQTPFTALPPPALPQPPISQSWMESGAKPEEDQ
ncbi:receptor 5 [Podarcis lilfordi]|uniref:Receptor 5 n=1 Tax=Podarcis lilfordi TaxID=74358 RepID=A0AA35L7U9_9SAUR|nr:receptor 5 [Podarcis lilfordi]